MKTKFTIVIIACVAIGTLSFVSGSNASTKGETQNKKIEVSKTGEPIGGFASADQL